MGTKTNPGEFDCYGKLEDDEPFFVLMGRDPRAADLVRQWARSRFEKAASNPDSLERTRQVSKAAEAMRLATEMGEYYYTRRRAEVGRGQ